MKNENILNIDFMLRHLKLAGFTIKTVNNDDKYIVVEHPYTNTYSQLFQINNNCKSSIRPLKTESDFFKMIFEECKKVGRIQVRQELHEAISVFNYD